ncbi:bifunctional serine/threonine-protein kinase/formylglycine-generating enzyme family protein [Rivularia sp. UHCC 0363]|uniref:bifunctional serine/threonine-protein kinase/formylglycine-generating enzyme family protein n=1 Tax=Rivularia sp. UHCC 0363 TaxID=3110244 RepID=UPI002B20155B|nr:bifunctional serine/threonine-protein kinase/formylglycine-generating enzyme family protein [Rivularia sp. UHCC 0363]MEA5598549.1 bifunctional serine/threonine-protein kinase/formylglycine-generating enzyme family protein [Rivularia sp. UHCC 0363]
MNTLVGRYEITQTLGGGGFAITYLARDIMQPSKPLCVVKQLRPNQTHPRVIDFFNKEAAILEKLGKHPQIPQLLAHFQENDNLYIVQEYIQGHDLSREISPGKRLSEAYVSKLLQDVLEVLSFVHKYGVIHRDIKPQNLMRRREDGKIFLIDFGAVKELASLMLNSQGEIKSSVVIGTPGFMPTEQGLGKPCLASDVYAVGMTAIQALTGLQAFELEENPQTGEVIWLEKAQVSQHLAEVITKMVRRHYSLRYASAKDALQGLTPIAQPTPIAPRKLNPSHSINYFTEDLGNGVTLEMVEIPDGEFLMGSPADEKEREDSESPQHKVTVESFMGKFAVTQAQYQAIMGKNPSNFKGEKRPVEKVSWNDATEFCKKLTEKTGRTYRLPSEAEWEYACRAGTTTPFHFGETITTDLANYNGNETYANEPKGKFRKKTTEVGSFPPNGFGLYDMHGNVWEWCQDGWHLHYNGAPTDGSAWIENGNDWRKVLRGGSWFNNPELCRSAFRTLSYPCIDEDCLYLVGFRVVCGVGRNS